FTIADFVADLRAATPSAAAELLVQEQEAMLEALQEMQVRLVNGAQRAVEEARLTLRGLVGALKNPRDRIQDLQIRFDDWTDRLAAAARRRVERNRDLVGRLEAGLKALSPLQVLERGYAIAFDSQGRAVRSAKLLPAGTRFDLRLSDGSITAESGGPAR
ncbi:MAG: exodeoxyribonuclease VII large subunit, partial [Bdellovibrionota bacterium]